MARIEQAIEVNVPVHAAYDQLTRFEQYPRFLEDMAEVRQIDDTHLHCHTKAGDLDLRWDAEITQQVPDRAIAWRHMHEPCYEGRVELEPLGQDRTRVKLTVGCEHDQQILAAYGTAENALMQRAEHDLARFKTFLENPQHESAADKLTKPSRESVQSVYHSRLVQSSDPSVSKDTGSTPRHGEDQHYADPLAALWQMWEDPFGLMRKMSRDFDQMLEQVRAQMRVPISPSPGRDTPACFTPTNGSAIHPWTPAVEVTQRDQRLTITAELPGVKRNDVHVSVLSGRITIEGGRQNALHGQDESQQYCHSERFYGPFRRVVALPEEADASQAAARLRDGVLEISMPVVPQGKAGRSLEVRYD